MAKMRMVDTRFWDDVWVVDRLTPLDRYLMLYFLTNSKTNVAGVYEISLRTIGSETGLDKEMVIKMIRRLEPRVRYIDGWIVLQNAIKHQNYKSPKIKTGIEIVLEMCPNNVLEFIQWPKDWTIPVNIANKLNKQGSMDLLGYGIDTISHSNSNSNSNSKVSLDKVSKSLATSPALKPKLGKGYKTFKEQQKKLQSKKSL